LNFINITYFIILQSVSGFSGVVKLLKNHLDADFAENAEKTLKLFEKLAASQTANYVKFFAQKFKQASDSCPRPLEI